MQTVKDVLFLGVLYGYDSSSGKSITNPRKLLLCQKLFTMLVQLHLEKKHLYIINIEFKTLNFRNEEFLAQFFGKKDDDSRSSKSAHTRRSGRSAGSVRVK